MVMEIVLSVVLLFVGIAVLVVIHICIVGRAFRRGYEDGTISMQNLVRISSSSNGTSNCKKMSAEDLKMLPSFDYKAADDESTEKGRSSPVDCVVCLENFRDDDKCKSLPNCNHSFHSQCIDSWLLKTPICPICRTCIAADSSKVGMNSASGEETATVSSHGAELV